MVILSTEKVSFILKLSWNNKENCHNTNKGKSSPKITTLLYVSNIKVLNFPVHVVKGYAAI